VYPEAVALEFLVREGFGNVQIMGQSHFTGFCNDIANAHP
jgi:hypothetical protein